jgi:excisionase family DNA binding protein
MSRRPALAIVPAIEPQPRPAVDLQDAARIIGVKDRSIRRLLDKGELQGYKPLTGKVCIYTDSIEAFQQRKKQLGLTGQPDEKTPPRVSRVDHSAHRQAVSWLKARGYL